MSRAPSLTWRLAALFACLVALLLALSGGALYVASDRHFREQDAHDLHGRAQIVANLAARYENAALHAALDQVLVSHHELAVVLFGVQGEVLYAREPAIHAAAGGSAPALATDHVAHEGGLQSFTAAGGHWRAFTMSTADGRRVWLAIGIDHHIAFLDALRNWLLLGGGLAALAGAGLGVVVARRGLAPLQKISAVAASVSAQRLSQRLDAERLPRELQGLAEELNGMLARLDDAFRRLNEFSSDLAHELRTPIANLTTQTEVALTRERPSDEYRDILASNLEEFGRLSRMIGDMLFLARAEHGLLVINRQPVALDDLVDDLLSFYDALAESRGLRLQREGATALTLEGDPLMLRRALSNLLSNALRHAAAGSAVTIELAQRRAAVDIAVINSGDDIAPEHLPRLFDRFYRADASRQRTAGDGAGLGLGIVKSIADAHGGRVSASSSGGLTRFALHLPAADVPGAARLP